MNRLLRSQLRRHPFGHKCFNLVPNLDVIKVVDPDTALHAAGDLLRVVLEALERTQLALEDRFASAGKADVCIPAQYAIEHPSAGDRTHLGNPEDVEHFRSA